VNLVVINGHDDAALHHVRLDVAPTWVQGVLGVLVATVIALADDLAAQLAGSIAV
jgi:hypothetical protein